MAMLSKSGSLIVLVTFSKKSEPWNKRYCVVPVA